MQNKIVDNVIEFSLKAKPDLQLLDQMRLIFLSLGFGETDFTEFSGNSTIGIATYLTSILQAKALEKRIRQFPLDHIQVDIRRLASKDWKEKWKRDFKPLALTKDVEVIPTWHQRGYKPKKQKIVYIDTTLAFGTGLHETTRFVACLMSRCEGNFERFLDVGTGSGILAIVAHLYGARDILAIDIDKECIPVAETNASVNQCPFIQFRPMDVALLKNVKPFDFVAANLCSDDLIRLKNKLVSLVKPGKYLAVSGISLVNYDRLIEKFNTLPLTCLKIERGKEWAAILYKRWEG